MSHCWAEFRTSVQCLQSSLAQDGGANHRQHCITDGQKALKTLIKMSQQLPGMFEIVLRSLWWAAGNEQPSPPLHRAAAARLLRRSHVLRQYFSAPTTIFLSFLHILFLKDNNSIATHRSIKSSCQNYITKKVKSL